MKIFDIYELIIIPDLYKAISYSLIQLSQKLRVDCHSIYRIGDEAFRLQFFTSTWNSSWGKEIELQGKDAK